MVKQTGNPPEVSDETKTAARALCHRIFSLHPEVERALVFVNGEKRRIRCRAILGGELPRKERHDISQTIRGEVEKTMISPLLPGHSINSGDISFEVSGVEQSSSVIRIICDVKSLFGKI